jgi:hypothetical protein
VSASTIPVTWTAIGSATVPKDRFPRVAEVVDAAAVGIVASGAAVVGAAAAEVSSVAAGVPARSVALVGVGAVELTASLEVDAVSMMLEGLPVVGAMGVGALIPGAGGFAHPANSTPTATNVPSIAVQCRPITRPASEPGDGLLLEFVAPILLQSLSTWRI